MPSAPSLPASSNAQGSDLQPDTPAHRGGRRLRKGVALYVLVIMLPVLTGVAAQVAVLPWKDVGELVLLYLYTLPSYWGMWALAGLFLLSPFLTLRGSNNARTLAGVLALFGAMAAFPCQFAVFSEEARWLGLTSLILFPVFCWLTHAFLISTDVQAYVTFVRIQRGWTASIMCGICAHSRPENRKSFM